MPYDGALTEAMVARGAGRRLLRSNMDPRVLRPMADAGPPAMRANASLMKDEWKQMMATVRTAARDTLTGLATLGARGLTTPLTGAMGTTIYEWQTSSDQNAAEAHMLASHRVTADIPDFGLTGVPVPIVRHDSWYDIRGLEASRRGIQPLDTFQTGESTVKVMQKLDDMLFQGAGITHGGYTLYGMENHPSANFVQMSNGPGTEWNDGTTTGLEILTDVLGAINKCIVDNHDGPYGLFVPLEYFTTLAGEYATGYPGTIYNRLLEIPGLEFIEFSARTGTDECYLIELNQRTITILDGIQPQPVEWSEGDGMAINIAVIAIQIPVLRAAADGKMGLCIINKSGT